MCPSKKDYFGVCRHVWCFGWWKKTSACSLHFIASIPLLAKYCDWQNEDWLQWPSMALSIPTSCVFPSIKIRVRFFFLMKPIMPRLVLSFSLPWPKVLKSNPLFVALGLSIHPHYIFKGTSARGSKNPSFDDQSVGEFPNYPGSLVGFDRGSELPSWHQTLLAEFFSRQFSLLQSCLVP